MSMNSDRPTAKLYWFPTDRSSVRRESRLNHRPRPAGQPPTVFGSAWYHEAAIDAPSATPPMTDERS